MMPTLLPTWAQESLDSVSTYSHLFLNVTCHPCPAQSAPWARPGLPQGTRVLSCHLATDSSSCRDRPPHCCVSARNFLALLKHACHLAPGQPHLAICPSPGGKGMMSLSAAPEGCVQFVTLCQPSGGTCWPRGLAHAAGACLAASLCLSVRKAF